jgi:transformation/transcription domain-associated protein
MLLEILNRLPNNEMLRPNVQSMLSLCMKLLETDNEENAVICLHIIFDLHKNFRPTLEREVRGWRPGGGGGRASAVSPTVACGAWA